MTSVTSTMTTTETTTTTAPITPVMTGSDTAKSGFKAEEIFRKNEDIKKSLQDFFQKEIAEIKKAPHGMKYDNIIVFKDGTEKNIQNKKILSYGGRGDSFDRRHINKTFSNQFIRKYLTLLTLIRKNKRETSMSLDQKKDFVRLCNQNMGDIKNYLSNTLLGESNKNDYWCVMKTDKNFASIELYIISSIDFYDFVEKSIKINVIMKPNGTCLHISPYISLQRKGGGISDHSPNHIQAKLKVTQEMIQQYTRIL